MSEDRTNRVEKELRQWQKQEIRFGKLFSLTFSDHKILLEEKLHYFDGIATKYRKTNDQQERFTLRLLRQEIRQIAKLIYPNLLWRIWKRIVISSFSQSRNEPSIKKNNIRLEQARNLHSTENGMRKQLHTNDLNGSVSQTKKSHSTKIAVIRGDSQYTTPPNPTKANENNSLDVKNLNLDYMMMPKIKPSVINGQKKKATRGRSIGK